MRQIGGFPPRHRRTLESFGFPGCHESIDRKRRGPAYDLSKWMQKLYGCTVQVRTGEKRCLVKEGVGIWRGEPEKLIF